MNSWIDALRDEINKRKVREGPSPIKPSSSARSLDESDIQKVLEKADRLLETHSTYNEQSFLSVIETTLDVVERSEDMDVDEFESMTDALEELTGVASPDPLISDDEIDDADIKLLFKICLIGDGRVGKTTLRHRFIGDKGFNESYIMTIGADFALKEITIGNIPLTFQIWDLAGQPHFKSVRSVYYAGAGAAVVVFDITRPKTFANSILWINELWKNTGKGPVPIILLGNKTDMRYDSTVDSSQFVNDEDARKFCKLFSLETARYKGFIVPYLPTSAKTGLNVNKAFDYLGRILLRRAISR